MAEKKIMTISRTDAGIEYNIHEKTDITWLVGMLEYIKIKVIAEHE